MVQVLNFCRVLERVFELGVNILLLGIGDVLGINLYLQEYLITNKRGVNKAKTNIALLHISYHII